MVLFILSFILVFVSSYFITSILSPKKSILGLIYLFLIAFAQIVLTFEILSLFHAIRQIPVLAWNLFFLTGSIFVWNKNNRPIWSLEFKDFRNKLNNSLKLDKALMWLYVGFCIFIFSAITLCLISPITSADGWGYHVARSLYWVLQGSLNHFHISDIRCLCLPINSEILYAWVLLFVKKDVLLGFFSFTGFVLAIVSLYNILCYIGYCIRKRLWIIFILSSIPSVLIQASGSTETDIIIAGLVLSSIFLFWTSLRSGKRIPLYMSALAYALAIGTKTTSLIMLPGVGLFMLWLCYSHKKHKELLYFLGFGVINFIIFASYNYILNFLQFGNFLTNDTFEVVSKNYYGFKGFVANFIKYIFMFIDSTGLKWGNYINYDVQQARTAVLNYLHLGMVQDGLYNLNYKVNCSILEPIVGAGLLGLFVYLPCWIFSLIKPLFNLKKKKNQFIFAFSLLFLINLLVISYVLTYMVFSVRFMMTFIALSAPILVYSYFPKKNFFKTIIVFFAMFYLVVVSTHIWPRPFARMIPILLEKGISKVRWAAICTDFIEINKNQSSACALREALVSDYSKKNKILLFSNSGSDPLFVVKSLSLEGYEIDMGLLEEADEIDFNKYNLIIFPNKPASASFIKNTKNWTKYYKKMPNGDIDINKKELIPCFYVENVRLPKSVKFRIYETKCSPTKEFFKVHNLTTVDYAGYIVPKAKYYDYFTIYENKNLPLLKK